MIELGRSIRLMHGSTCVAVISWSFWTLGNGPGRP
eukprot:IDg10754t1